MGHTSSWLKAARLEKGWSQVHAAARLGVTQGYLSLLERGRRAPSARLAKTFERVYGGLVAPESPPVPRDPATEPDELARNLAALGYEPFGYLNGRSRPAPEQVLLGALRNADLDARLTEALPWVVVTYPALDWDWLVDRAKRHDLQNRLGYVVTLARELAQKRGDARTSARLLDEEKRLEPSVLAREDTLCRESMTRAERKWLVEARPDQAKRWHLLTDLRVEHLGGYADYQIALNRLRDKDDPVVSSADPRKRIGRRRG